MSAIFTEKTKKVANRPNFIKLHSACGDSREILINIDHIIAVHGSFDLDDAYDDELCYETTVIVTDGIGQEVTQPGFIRGQDWGIYKVNEDLETVWCKIYGLERRTAYGQQYTDDRLS